MPLCNKMFVRLYVRIKKIEHLKKSYFLNQKMKIYGLSFTQFLGIDLWACMRDCLEFGTENILFMQ